MIATDILLKNGRVVDFAGKTDRLADVLIADGIVKAVGEISERDSFKIIDCTNLTVIPGLFDMHVHLRDPGQTHKEDIITGCEAAAAGGVTGVLAMPNTMPVIDSPEMIQYVNEKSKNAKVRVYSASAITKGQNGMELCDFSVLKAAGAVAASDDGKPVKNAAVMSQAMLKAAKAGLTVISHCEDLDIINGGIINEGKVSDKLGVPGMSRASENIVTQREIYLARDYGSKIHIAHVSTKEAVDDIKAAKEKGINVTCETAPHYFTLTDNELLKKDADYRMNPPLREQADLEAITNALITGIIDVIVTDHAPHTVDEKSDFLTAPNGVIGLETSLAVTLTMLYHKKKLSLMDIVRLMCANPRKILGLPGGEIRPGELADITIFDPNEEWTVEPEKMHSKSKNSCFKGMKLRGRVKYTLVHGEIVYRDFE